MAEQRKTRKVQPTTMKRSQNNKKSDAQTAKEPQKKPQTEIKQTIPASKTKAKAVTSRNNEANKKNKKGKLRVGRTFMLTLMAAYLIVMLIVGGWAFQNFFAFLFAEKSPVMGVNTESSRVKDTPEISSDMLKKGIEAIKNSGYPVEKIEITQIGPSLHFYIVVPEHVGLDEGRDIGKSAIIIFADTIEKPELYATYEAQIIVTKAKLPELTPEEILRPASDDGAEQTFPQYGVSNKHTGGNEKNVSWANNGV